MLVGCDSDSRDDSPSEIMVYQIGLAYQGVNINQKPVFSGDDILWFDEKTREIKFKDNSSIAQHLPFGEMVVFKQSDVELFTAHVLADTTQVQYDDLSLVYNTSKKTYYLYDCYPKVLDRPSVQLNANIRAENWTLFLIQLRKESRIK
jgi:hypothetical protein